MTADQVEGEELPESTVYRTPVGSEAEGRLLEPVPGDESVFEDGRPIGSQKEPPPPVGRDNFRGRDNLASGVDVRQKCRQNRVNLGLPGTLSTLSFLPKKE